MTKKTILCFDNWLKGIENFERFSVHLDRDEFDVVLVHLGHWLNLDQVDQYDASFNLKILDICDLETRNPLQVIKNIQPDLILVTQNNTFYNKAIIVASRLMDVPTVLMAHGLMTTSLASLVLGPKTSIWSKIKNIIQRVTTQNLLLELFWYCYVHQKVSWSNLFKTLIALKYRVKFDNYASEDSKTNFMLVYTNADRKFCSEYFGIEMSSVKVIGIPELDQRHVFNEQFEGAFPNRSDQDPFGIYIESKVLHKKFQNDHNKFTKYLEQLQQKCNEQGFKLKFDLHPNTAFEFCTKINSVAGDILSEGDLMIYKDASFIICDPTTKSVIATYLSKPLILNIDTFPEHHFAQYFQSYPFVYKSLNSLSEKIDDTTHLKMECNEIQKLKEWKDLYLSASADGLTTGERAAACIQSFISME